MKNFRTEIIANMPVSDRWRLLEFEWPDDLGVPEPGQFFTFLPEGGSSPALLRRPLAFAGFGKDSGSGRATALSLYQIRGPGTSWLSGLGPGETLDLLAPLGNTFPLPQAGEFALAAGGGIGIGPVLFYLSKLLKLGLRQNSDFLAALGFRTGDSIPDLRGGSTAGTTRDHAAGDADPAARLSLFRAFEASILATDDGSAHFRGTALDALKAAEGSLRALQSRPALYCACGPMPMLAEVARRSAAEQRRAYVSVEQWMACGVGACHGCVLPARGGTFVRACADGPVFEANVLDLSSGRGA